MTAQPVEEDGNVIAAKRNLEHAVHLLIEPRSTIVNDTIVHSSSLYMQLWDAVGGESSNGGGSGGGSKSRPPFWTDAFVLVDEINTAVECWQPAFTGTPPTVGRLRWIQGQDYRPQDCHKLEQITAAVLSWVAAIDELMNPTPKWSLAAACPACGATTVYRKDVEGEMVRSPALQINGDGCTCQKCRYTWGPQLFTHLAAVLGFPLPSGVLE